MIARLMIRAVPILCGLVIGWVASDAFDWWRRRRGTRRAKADAPEGRIPPRHIRRQQAKRIARRVTRALAEPLGPTV